jgi:catechol 2,3-dioxygenase-like lactoylglutathione lyase family enzyme
MRTTSYYPVLLSDDVAKASAFYQRHFGFAPLYASDWYVHLQSETDPGVNLALVAKDHPTVPAAGRGKTGGVILNFEVHDVDAEYERLSTEEQSFALPLRDEEFGQRHFILHGPDGVLIDIIRPIPPSAEHAALYAKDAAPR